MHDDRKSGLGQVLVRVVDYPRTILLLTLVTTAVFASFLPHLKLAGALESILPEDSEELQRYKDMRERYGKSDYAILLISGAHVLDLDYLQTLRELHYAIEQRVPHIDTVESLVNARYVSGARDQLNIEDLLQLQPKSAADLLRLRERLDGSQMYYGRLINEREDSSAVFIQLDTQIPVERGDGEMHYRPILETEIAASIAALEAISEQFAPRFDAKLILGGETVIATKTYLAIDRDFRLFIGVSLVIICAILGLIFRRPSAILLPVLSMGISVTISMALLPILGFTIQPTTSVLPSFLLTVCLGDAVHLLTRFYRYYDRGQEKREALVQALSECQLPILLTSLTTAAGLMALAGSAVIPVKTLGIIAGAGCLIAWLITVVVLPALIMSCPLRRRKIAGNDRSRIRDPLRILSAACYRFSTRFPRSIVAVFLTLFAVSLLFASKLQITNNVYLWFDEDHPIRASVDAIEDNLSGSTMFELIFDTGRPRGVYEPALLRQFDSWLKQLEGMTVNDIRVGKVDSLLGLLKETNRVMHGGDAAHYAIPDSRDVIAQALLLVEMDRADDLYRYTDDSFSELRVILLNTSGGARDILKIQEQIGAEFIRHVDVSAPLLFTGMAQMMPRILQDVGNTMIQSYLIGIAMITGMMMLLMQSIRLGLVAMLPNLFPITVVMAVMSLTAIPLDMFTVVLAPIALGIAVDDTLHFMHGVKRSYALHGCTRQAIEDSLSNCGRAMIITTVTLCLGFLVYALSDLQPMFHFGLLMSLSVALALLADFILAPALLMLVMKDTPTAANRPGKLDRKRHHLLRTCKNRLTC